MEKEFLLGLDLGTESIGWALADSDYKILDVKDKKALGVLMFSTAKTAEERRMSRTARRRLQRRSYRITLLQEIFNDALMAKDINFLARLKENDLHQSDKKTIGKYSLFNDKNFTDVQYYAKYPTIYHLRKHLMENQCNDVRLLYLACHHIVKYRGHFLNGNIDNSESADINSTIDYKSEFENLNNLLYERNQDINDNIYEGNIIDEIATNNLSLINDIICEKGEVFEQLKSDLEKKADGKYKNIYVTSTDKINKVIEVLQIKNTVTKTLIKIIFKGNVNLTTLFSSVNYSKDEAKGFNLGDDLELVADMSLLQENPQDLQIILSLKKLYDWAVLTNLLKGKTNISECMIDMYNNHKKDLNQLKKFIVKYAKDKYDSIFGVNDSSKNDSIPNYTKYIGGGRYDGKKVGNNGRIGSTADYKDFKTFLLGILKQINVEECSEEKAMIMTRLENDEFLPKIVSKNNSAISYQLNMQELNIILQNASKNPIFTFLNNVENGWSVINKIKSLLRFRIPYYVGTLKQADETQQDGKKSKKQNAWIVRKPGRITPWTFDDLVDKEKSGTAFIEKMTCSCTYLKNAKTLPKNSILFSKYVALNELNNMKINGEEIKPNIKQAIFNDIYLTTKPTLSKIKKYLIEKNICDKDVILTGTDINLTGNMNSYLTYKSKLHEKVDKYPQMIEKLIFLSTIHNDSRLIAQSAKKEFGDIGILTDKEINDIKGFKFNGWGALSYEFLNGANCKNGLKLCDLQGEYCLSIIDIMYQTNRNLQQILANEQYCYKQAIENYMQDNGIIESNNITYDDVAQMYCSPSVKRCVWQAFELVKDLVKNTKVIPSKIFLESTRTNTDKDKGKRSKTRREIILENYQEARKFADSLLKEKKNINDDKALFAANITSNLDKFTSKLSQVSDEKLASERVYLYFMQLGKCVYTGKPIDLENITNINAYDVDHIFPQSKVKDDSLDNKVLVLQSANKEKGDKYPLPYEYRQESLWHSLYKAKLMSENKYTRLTRKSPLTEEEQEKFINRQLVETSQSIMLVKELLERYFKDSPHKVEIVLSRAANISDFRKVNGLTKSRDINDFHHAFDAYYNIVVGNILNQEYNHNWHHRKISPKDKSCNFAKTIKSKMEKSNNELLNLVKSQVNTHQVNITKKIETGKGELFKATIFPAEDKKDSSLIPLQYSKFADGKEVNPKSDTSKYGGYKTSGTAYFVVVDSTDKKGNIIRSIEPISIYEDKNVNLGKTTINKVLLERNLINAKLATINGLKGSILKVGSLLDFGNYKLRLTGANINQLLFHNANQLFASAEINDYMKEITVIIEKANKKNAFVKDNKDFELNNTAIMLIDKNIERASLENQTSKIIIITKEENIKLYEYFISKLSANPYKDIPSYSNLTKILQLGKDDFTSKNIYEQIVLLKNIVMAFQCNAKKVDVSSIKYTEENKNKTGGKNQCSIATSHNITQIKKLQFISQSKSGLKEHRIDLTLPKVKK